MTENPYKRQAYQSAINFGNELWNMYQAKTLLNTKGNEAFVDRVSTIKKNNKKRDIFNVLDKMKDVQKNVTLSQEQKTKELLDLKKELNTVKTNVILDGSEPKQVIEDAIDIYAKQTPELYNYLFVSSKQPFDQSTPSSQAVSKLKEAKDMLKAESKNFTAQQYKKLEDELTKIQKNLQNSLLSENPNVLKQDIENLETLKGKILSSQRNINTSLSALTISNPPATPATPAVRSNLSQEDSQQFQQYMEYLRNQGRLPRPAPKKSRTPQNSTNVQEIHQDDEGMHFVESFPWGEDTPVMDYNEEVVQELNKDVEPRAPSAVQAQQSAQDYADHFISYVGMNPNDKAKNVDMLLAFPEDVVDKIANEDIDNVDNHPFNTLDRSIEVKRIINFARKMVVERRKETGMAQMPVSNEQQQYNPLAPAVREESPQSQEFKSFAESEEDPFQVEARKNLADDVEYATFVLQSLAPWYDKEGRYFVTGRFEGNLSNSSILMKRFFELKSVILSEKYKFHDAAMRNVFGIWIRNTLPLTYSDNRDTATQKINRVFSETRDLLGASRAFVFAHRVGNGRSKGKKAQTATKKKNFHIISFR